MCAAVPVSGPWAGDEIDNTNIIRTPRATTSRIVCVYSTIFDRRRLGDDDRDGRQTLRLNSIVFFFLFGRPIRIIFSYILGAHWIYSSICSHLFRRGVDVCALAFACKHRDVFIYTYKHKYILECSVTENEAIDVLSG